MISRSDYTNEEWVEVIARCRKLPFQVSEEKPLDGVHVLDAGDWVWIVGDGMELVYIDQEIGLCIEKHFVGDPEDADCKWFWDGNDVVWIPRLDQLVRMDGWDLLWSLSPAGRTGDKRDWIVYLHSKGHTDSVAEGPNPEFAALRALQRCLSECVGTVVLDEGIISQHDDCKNDCAGIHPPHSALHRCLSHTLVKVIQ